MLSFYCQKFNLQQFPLSTAAIASYLYPALGGADARNEGGALRAAPPCDPPSRKVFSAQNLKFQFPLSTAAIASYLYPALGGADARNEGGETLRNSPLRSSIA